MPKVVRELAQLTSMTMSTWLLWGSTSRAGLLGSFVDAAVISQIEKGVSLSLQESWSLF